MGVQSEPIVAMHRSCINFSFFGGKPRTLPLTPRFTIKRESGATWRRELAPYRLAIDIGSMSQLFSLSM